MSEKRNYIVHFLHSLQVVSLSISVMSLRITFTTGFPNSGNRQSKLHFVEKKAGKYFILEKNLVTLLFFFLIRVHNLILLMFKKVYKNLWGNTHLKSQRQKKLRMHLTSSSLSAVGILEPLQLSWQS